MDFEKIVNPIVKDIPPSGIRKFFDIYKFLFLILITLDQQYRTIINPGDEVILLQPSYVAYTPGVALAGGVVRNIILTEENEFKLTPELLKEAINEKTKAILLNYPSNPTGGFMTKEDYEKLVPIFKESGIMIITDEIYAELSYEHKFCSIASFDEIKDQVILVSGFSKAYAMTGWRLGYVLANEYLIKMMKKIHQYVIMSAPTCAPCGVNVLSPISLNVLTKKFLLAR